MLISGRVGLRLRCGAFSYLIWWPRFRIVGVQPGSRSLSMPAFACAGNVPAGSTVPTLLTKLLVVKCIGSRYSTYQTISGKVCWRLRYMQHNGKARGPSQL